MKMYIYKFNQFTGKHYKYDMDEYDIFSPMFDEGLHANQEVVAGAVRDSMTCLYCHTEFPSRNQLFYHLGYHNVDIRKAGDTEEYNCDDEMGDFGMCCAVTGDGGRRRKKRGSTRLVKMKRRSKRRPGDVAKVSKMLADMAL